MSGRKQRDETLYCERCGIAFLWSVEEQSAQSADVNHALTPTHCPGCRYLLPAEGRERGEVKFFNQRKQFGFLTRRNGGELFVHGSALPTRQRLSTGDLVEFSVAQTERGPAAEAVQVLERAANEQKASPS